MSGWRFLLTSRWAGYLGLTIAFAVACVALGNWQLARRAEAHAAVVKLDANYDSAPAPVATLLPALDAFEGSKEWSPARMRGTYLSHEQLLVRTRPLGGNPGFEVLVPLLLRTARSSSWTAAGCRRGAATIPRMPFLRRRPAPSRSSRD